MRTLSTAFLCALLMSLHAWAQGVESDPRGAVIPLMSARDVFYADVQRFQDGQLSEPQLVERIAEQFAPLVNQDKMALRVMGRHARVATPDERTRFTTQMQASLVEAYAQGLAGYGGEVLVLPEVATILAPGRAVVEARLEAPGRESLPIQFALSFEAEQGWKVENVVVAGINLGMSLRTQFDDLVKQTGSVAGAIDAWTLAAVRSQ